MSDNSLLSVHTIILFYRVKVSHLPSNTCAHCQTRLELKSKTMPSMLSKVYIESGTEWNEHHTECREHHIECNKHHIECREHHIQCREHHIQCNEHHIQCNKPHKECREHHIQYSEHHTQCNEHHIECGWEEKQDSPPTPVTVYRLCAKIW